MIDLSLIWLKDFVAGDVLGQRNLQFERIVYSHAETLMMAIVLVL